MNKNIFLIGFMGAGKTHFGKRLAKKMGYTFIDSDYEIEKETNLTIAEIFSNEGENGFRERESKWIQNLNVSKHVIALGGGTPCYRNNLEVMHTKGRSIYLKLAPSLLVERLQNSESIRPLIEPFKRDSEKLLAFIQLKLKEREMFYEQATFLVNGMILSVDKIEKSIEEEDKN